jgi:hypothetical protein
MNSNDFLANFQLTKIAKKNININIKITSSDTNKSILERTRELYNLEKSNTGYYYCKEARLLYYQEPCNTTTRK